MPEIEVVSDAGDGASEASSLDETGGALFGKYELGKLLGRGAFAKVYHARDVSSGQSVAIKAVSKQKVLKGGFTSNVKREISIMRRLQHPHIVKLYEVLATKTKIYFIMEFAKGGELFGKISKGRFSEDLSRRYFQQLVSAVGYCHSRGVYHRDLKPENLLLDENWNLKVSDFGLSAVMEQMKKDSSERNQAASGAFNVELQSIRDAIEAAKETVRSKDDAYLRRCEALQRSLKASEATTKMWRQRAEIVESLLLKERQPGDQEEDSIYVVNGGRIDLLTNDDSQKWKLLSDGPRREIPQWMARRICTIRTKFPPRKIDVAEALSSEFRSLNLPKPEEVWSIALEKPKEGDTLVEHVFEKEIIEKKRKALERALQRKSTQWQRTEEQTKLGSSLHSETVNMCPNSQDQACIF